MKNNSQISKAKYAICIVAACLFLSMRVAAQVPYRPFTDGCQWSVSDDKYASAGDTVINGVTYMKIYTQHANQSFEFSLPEAQYFTAIREDTVSRKVYCIMPAGTLIRRNNHVVGQTEAPREFLLYDYSLEIGDTVTCYTICKETSTYEVNEGFATRIDSYDTLIHLSDGTPHNVMRVHVEVNYIFPHDTWIEGIGSTLGFNIPFFNNPDIPAKQLLCFTNAEGAGYQTGLVLDDNPDDCYNKNYNIGITEREAESFKVYPNPANQTFTISFTEAQESVKQVRVMDMLGKEVMSVENLSSNTFNIAHLPVGTYIVQVISISGKEYASKLVKK